jgi:hypothetical protein
MKAKSGERTNLSVANLYHQLKRMPGRPLSPCQLLQKFRDTLFQIAVGNPHEVEAGKAILRSLMRQNPTEIKRKLLEQELNRDRLFREFY